jgi:integrase
MDGKLRDKLKWVSLGNGLYERGPATNRFYHRVKLHGQWTFRRLAAVTVSVARRELTQKQNLVALAECGIRVENPYDRPKLTVGMLLDQFREAGCPKTKGRNIVPRHGHQLDHTLSRLRFLEAFFGSKIAAKITLADCDGYQQFRRNDKAFGLRGGVDGGASLDLELSALSGIFHWAMLTGKLESNPITLRATYRKHDDIKHCRDYMPHSTKEFHDIGRYLLAGGETSEALGFQYLLEGMTGCRTGEVLAMRWDAGPNQPGFLQGNSLSVVRAKGGINPYVKIHPALANLLDAMRQWRVWRGLDRVVDGKLLCPWFIPSPVCHRRSEPMHNLSLCKALGNWTKQRQATDPTARKYTSHAARAWYVLVRRSQQVPDLQIAWELGDKSGAAIIVQTYGGIPANFLDESTPPLQFADDNPAWLILNMPTNVVGLNQVA